MMLIFKKLHIYMPKSHWLCGSLYLAALKIGAIYLPISYYYPFWYRKLYAWK